MGRRANKPLTGLRDKQQYVKVKAGTLRIDAWLVRIAPLPSQKSERAREISLAFEPHASAPLMTFLNCVSPGSLLSGGGACVLPLRSGSVSPIGEPAISLFAGCWDAGRARASGWELLLLLCQSSLARPQPQADGLVARRNQAALSVVWDPFVVCAAVDRTGADDG